jgi:hypothetical protein
MASVILLRYLVFHFQNLGSMLQTLNYIKHLIFIKVITCMWKLREKPGNVNIRQQFARAQLTVWNLTNSPGHWCTEKTMESINGPLRKYFIFLLHDNQPQQLLPWWHQKLRGCQVHHKYYITSGTKVIYACHSFNLSTTHASLLFMAMLVQWHCVFSCHI